MRRKTKQRMKYAIPIIIVFIMVFSVVGFALSGGGGNSEDVNGFTFKFRGNLRTGQGYWQTKIDGERYDFYVLPEDVKYIEMGEFDTSAYSEYYLVSNPEANYTDRELELIALSKYELEPTLEKFGKIAYNAFSTNYSGREPVTCANAASFIAVVNFEIKNESTIKFDNNCITISGRNGVDVVRAKDKLMLKILGVI